MTARLCDVCRQVIEQKDDEFLRVHIGVLDSTEGADQDEKASAYGDFCDGCIHNGDALASLLKELKWTLEPQKAEATK